MLRLRDEQKLTLLEEARPRLVEWRVRRLCAIVAKSYPGICSRLTKDDLRAWVERTLAVAGEHGIESLDNQARYVHLTFVAGQRELHESPEHPWVGKILSWPDSEEALKLEMLERRAATEFNR